eukprot:scaffold1051_cov119-Cylindrotheca_fusiformis.AAC.17
MKRPAIMDENKKKRRSETGGGNDPGDFVFTVETKDTDVTRTTLTRLRIDSSVTEIPSRAFDGCKALVQVELPETLTIIGFEAFCQCVSLKSIQFVSSPSLESSQFTHSLEDGLIVFPERAKLHIEARAFVLCESLRKVIVCSASTTLGPAIFRCCSGLTYVQLPEGLHVIEEEMFDHCLSLTTVKLPSTVRKIGNRAFIGCRSLASLDLPNGLLEIGSISFWSCKSIETLHIPSTVSTIGSEAFVCCARLTYVELPLYLETIEEKLFMDCRSLEYVEIPVTVKTILQYAFRGCSSLSHIRIPPSVDTVGSDAFAGCKSLISIELPEGLSLSNYRAFLSEWHCPSLMNVAFPTLTARRNYDLDSGTKLYSVTGRGGNILVKLKHRFDKSPLNKLCYYQSYYSMGDAIEQLHSLMDEDPLAATSQVDEFGMTPLHILSLSQTPNLSMLLAVIKGGYPNQIVGGRDLFQSTPMDYLCLNRNPNTPQVIRSLLQIRLDRLGLARWKSELLQEVDQALALVDRSARSREVSVAYFKLAKYERMEILSLVELCLWKVKIEEVRSAGQYADRQSCRINNGSHIVISNVLPFLDKLDMEE